MKGKFISIEFIAFKGENNLRAMSAQRKYNLIRFLNSIDKKQCFNQPNYFRPAFETLYKF